MGSPECACDCAVLDFRTRCGSGGRSESDGGTGQSEKTVRLSELNSAMKGNSVNAKLNNIKNKLMAKGSDTGNGPTAVAGVRGDNVYEQNKAALKHDLYWEP